MRNHAHSAVLTALLVLSGAAVANAGPVVYNQPATFPPTTGAVWTSERTANDGQVWQTYDNFTLGTIASIATVTWQGIYLNDFAAAPFADATGFDIQFWSNVGGQPGVLLSTATLGIAAVNETFAGNILFFGNQSPVYNYRANLPAQFLAQAGTEYWFSVVERAPAGFRPNIWGWTSGTGGDGASYQQYFPDASVSGFRSGDRAFSLEAVPEPGSLLLLGTGLAGLVAYRARRARRA